MSDNNHLSEERVTFNWDGASEVAPVSRGKKSETHRVKIFKSGNSLALRLPKALGLKLGAEVEITIENGRYVFQYVDAPKRKIDVSKFAGKAPWLKELAPEDRVFEHRELDWHLLEATDKRP